MWVRRRSAVHGPGQCLLLENQARDPPLSALDSPVNNIALVAVPSVLHVSTWRHRLFGRESVFVLFSEDDATMWEM